MQVLIKTDLEVKNSSTNEPPICDLCMFVYALEQHNCSCAMTISTWVFKNSLVQLLSNIH